MEGIYQEEITALNPSTLYCKEGIVSLNFWSAVACHRFVLATLAPPECVLLHFS